MRRKLLMITTCIGAMAAAGGGEVVGRRWAGKAAPATHPDTLKVVTEGGTTRLVFDLSALPKGARVHRASLRCFVTRRLQPREPAELYAVKSIGAEGKAACAGRRLALEPPWYGSFDATEAVRRWARDPKSNLGLAVVRFDGLQAKQTWLDVLFEGRAKEVPPQVTGLKVSHHDDQTFLWWKEIPPYQPPPGSVVWIDKFSEKGCKTVKQPGKGWGGYDRFPAVAVKVIRDMQGVVVKGTRAHRVKRVPQVLYRVYRHDRKTTSSNLQDAELLAEVPALNAYDLNMKIISYRGEYHDAKEVPTSLIPTLPVADAKAVLPGEALYVHNPPKAGESYYAVTAVMDGTENTTGITAANSLARPVEERPGPGKPVFRFLLEDRYRPVPERWYLLYGAPPLANRPFRPFRVLVAVPPEKVKGPYAMSISGYTSGYVSMFEWRPSTTVLNLRVEYHTPWGEDGGLCYSNGLGTLRSYRESRVEPFSGRYLKHLIAWARATWDVDPGRVTGGPLHFAVRHPESTGMAYIGSYTYDYDFKWGGMPGALPRYCGPKDLAVTTDGHKAWNVLDIGWYLRNNVEKDIPFVHCVSGTGKDSGHTSEYGWQDDPRAWAALRDARQPFCAFWSCGSSGELSKLIRSMQWDKSIPAFSNCSLDNNPGCGDAAHGDYYGQINGYIFWEYETIVDEKDRWEITAFLTDASPEESCTVDITPRHCKKFKPAPGRKFKWTNTRLADGKRVATGGVEADKWGLVTIRQLAVTRGKNRIRILKP